MDESNMPSKNTPQKGPRSRAVLYVIVAACVAVVLLAVFIFKPAVPADTASQASAGTDSQAVMQQIDPLQVTSSLGGDISQFTYGHVEGQDYQVQPLNATTNAYTFASNLNFLNTADEQDNLIVYTDSTSNAINILAYSATIPKTEKSALLTALGAKEKALESVFGNSYQTAYYKDNTQTQSADSYTYQKIYDALSSGQAGIYSISWPISGVVVTLKIYNLPDQNTNVLQISYWAYAGAAASATP